MYTYIYTLAYIHLYVYVYKHVDIHCIISDQDLFAVLSVQAVYCKNVNLQKRYNCLIEE